MNEPIPHQAAKGIDGWVIEHPTGECAWCDAERWRSLPRERQVTLEPLIEAMVKGLMNPRQIVEAHGPPKPDTALDQLLGEDRTP